MNVRRTRFWLYAVSITAIAFGGLALGMAVAFPVTVASQFSGSRGGAPTTRAASDEPSASELQRLARRPLRQPLEDPASTPLAPMPIKISGTVTEPGWNRALITGSDGLGQFRSVGDVVDGVTITQIDVDSVTVQYADKTFVLRREPSTR